MYGLQLVDSECTLASDGSLKHSVTAPHWSITVCTRCQLRLTSLLGCAERLACTAGVINPDTIQAVSVASLDDEDHSHHSWAHFSDLVQGEHD